MQDILLLISGAILGVLGQWVFYRYQKRDEQKQGPMIVVSKLEHDGHAWLELRNIGQDTLTELTVKISWLSQAAHHEQLITQVQKTIEGPTSASDVIGNGEMLYGAGLPMKTDDGIIDVQVSGLGAKSKRLYTTISQLTVALL